MWHAHSGEIGLLFTDLVMPGGAGGLELSRQLAALAPGLRVIYTSGYSPDLFKGDVPLVAGVNYLPKPYLAQQLAAILRSALA
jgi:DNA-binding NtrC family response regulator